MTRDVRLRVRKCEVCQASKHGRPTETAGRRRIHAGRPWQVVAVDLVGPMPTTVRGNNWILVFLKFMRKRQLGRHHPYRWTLRTGDTTRDGRVASSSIFPSTVET